MPRKLSTCPHYPHNPQAISQKPPANFAPLPTPANSAPLDVVGANSAPLDIDFDTPANFAWCKSCTIPHANPAWIPLQILHPNKY